MPAALLVLLLVLQMTAMPAPSAEAPAPRAEARKDHPAPALLRPGRVALQDASGRRSAPWQLPAASAALVLDLGQAWQQQRVSVRLWRRDEDGNRQQPAWLTATPRVRSDGRLPIGGIAAGRYDVEVEAGGSTFASLTDVDLAPGAMVWRKADAPAAPGR